MIGSHVYKSQSKGGEDALLRAIFIHGHMEGWAGNQMRRDVQYVDAEKSWSLYVSNGALEKAKAKTLANQEQPK